MDQVPLSDALAVIEDGLDRAQVSGGVPIAPVDTIVIMKLLAGRTQDLADVEAIVDSGADRDFLRAAVQKAVPGHLQTLEQLFVNVDRKRQLSAYYPVRAVATSWGGRRGGRTPG